MSVHSRLATLRNKHAEMEKQVKKLGEQPGADSLEIVEMKKRKLAIKEEISAIEGGASPA